MPPKFKFSKQQIVNAALALAREKGLDNITARDIAKTLGVSTQPVFTCFSNMEEAKNEVRIAAEKIYDEYIAEGLSEKIPFFGMGKAYIKFAKDEPELYKALFLSDFASKSGGAAAAMKRSQEKLRPCLIEIYKITADEADLYFRDLWLVVHAIATLIVSGCCPFGDSEIGQILTEVSVSLCKSIKEIDGFAKGNFNKDEVFKKIIYSNKAGRKIKRARPIKTRV